LKTVLERATEVIATLSQHRYRTVRLALARISPRDPAIGNFKVIGVINNRARVVISEYIDAGAILTYSYTFIVGVESILRHDNAPHHRSVPTFPHHRHWRGEVESLEGPDLDSFLQEVQEWIQKNGID